MKKDRFEIFSTSIMHVVRSVQILKSHKMAEYGLKGTNAVCLCRLLEGEGGLTAAELSSACELDKAQVSRSMAELQEKGFVVREGDDERRYKQRYVFTPKGQHAALDIRYTISEIEEAASKNIPPASLDHFYHTLYKLCDNFDALIERHKAN